MAFYLLIIPKSMTQSINSEDQQKAIIIGAGSAG